MPSPSAGAHDAQNRIVWTSRDVRRLLRAPGERDDKRSRGVVALRTGSDAYPGAAVLGVEGAWRAGCGYVRYVGPRRAADLVLARRPETIVTDPIVADDRSVRVGTRVETAHALGGVRGDAWVIGSGTDHAGQAESETAALRELLAGTVPIVVDAGALALLPATAPVIATPHAGEFRGLRATLGLDPVDTDTLQDPARRADAVRETADALGGTVLLKGATTLIADPGAAQAIAVDAGTGWLATAGTGDVLAGVIGALLASRVLNPATPLAEVAATGTWLHGTAGRIAAEVGARRPGHPIVALDVAEALPAAFAFGLAADDAGAGHIEHHEETEEGRA
ncbi:ADP/ATP-dependent (S)-NAD(P)H-hydrate dehydratase [Microbacterium sp. MYb64]|uniref:ADP-dependent NAD(P)H-hydrate dehydratase n=1 Tax=Microbacterium sp. MYb64 TaxID=1848691 RepID=UPI000CFB65EE|nr:ADP/ATP-dependent (S)-NAD(P)H-hydrate dehydratase [Microbacterium sp. MYb64]PRB08284.1 NAD(P)H-hydrate dehydratase [Microbacterium sp. MYb64]